MEMDIQLRFTHQLVIGLKLEGTSAKMTPQGTKMTPPDSKMTNQGSILGTITLNLRQFQAILIPMDQSNHIICWEKEIIGILIKVCHRACRDNHKGACKDNKSTTDLHHKGMILSKNEKF
jgi:hypothetical protein